jgi:ferritin-like metal-binding protein YciE
MNTKQFEELLLQSLEHEMGGVEVYSAALSCAQNSDLKKEWQEYLEQTKKHVSALEKVCAALGIATDTETPGRAVVRLVGNSLVEAMKQALAAGDARAAELVACECVVLAETKDHADWQLLGKCAAELPGPAAVTLHEAYATIEDEEDEHLYHTRGWCRELWLQSLGLPAVLPPPEEQQHVKTAIGAARAEQAAEKLRLESREPT